MRGTISPRGGPKKYLARLEVPGGREVSRAFARKADAQRWLTATSAAVDSGGFVDPRAGRLTVGAWAESWMAGRAHLKPKTIASYRSLLGTQVLPRWERVPLTGVHHSDVVAWVASMRSGLSASRTRQAYHLFNAMLTDAVRDERLSRNPAAAVTLPRMPQAERRYLTHAQLADVAEGCGPHRLLVSVLGYTGLRWGEATGLRVGRVDPLRGRIEVVEAVTEINGRMVWGPPKTHQRRTVVLPRFLRDEMAVQLGTDVDALVFPSHAGTPLRGGNFRRDWFDEAARAAGVPGLVPHELRHTAASLAIGAGANIKAVQSMLGHASAAMTLDRYGHLMGDELDAVADRLDAARVGLPDYSRTSPASRVAPITPGTGEQAV
jgi:integrase